MAAQPLRLSSKERETSLDNPLESTFVRELKQELNLRSEVASRKADYNKHMTACL